MDFKYDPTAPTREDILDHGSWEATKRGRARFLRNAVNGIRSGCCRIYEECCRDLARSNGLTIPLERALLTHDILVSSSLFGFPTLLTIFSNLNHLFASFLHNILCSLVSVSSGVTTLTRRSSSLRKTKRLASTYPEVLHRSVQGFIRMRGTDQDVTGLRTPNDFFGPRPVRIFGRHSGLSTTCTRSRLYSQR